MYYTWTRLDLGHICTMGLKTILMISVFYFVLGCASTTSSSKSDASTQLNKTQVNDLIDNPEDWDGRVFILKAYPVDFGSKNQVYGICFEKCDMIEFDRIVTLLYAKNDRFENYSGNVEATVKVRFDGGCFTNRRICIDLKSYHFLEVD